MRITRMIATGGAAVAAAAVLAIGAAGVAGAATTDPAPDCTGTGPASTLSDAQHDAFAAEMDKLQAARDAILAEYGLTARGGRGTGQGQGLGVGGGAGQGRGAGQGQGLGAGGAALGQLGADEASELSDALAAWREARDQLFAEYGLTARQRGANA